jgi:hypothetical protein
MCRGSGSVAVGLVTRGEPKTGLGDWRGVAAWRHSTLAEGAVVRVYDFCPSASQVLRGFVVWCSFRLACEGPIGGLLQPLQPERRRPGLGDLAPAHRAVARRRLSSSAPKTCTRGTVLGELFAVVLLQNRLDAVSHTTGD